MVAFITGLPAYTLCNVAGSKITGDDCRKVLIPALKYVSAGSQPLSAPWNPVTKAFTPERIDEAKNRSATS